MKKNIQTVLIICILTGFLACILKYPKDVLESVSFSISIWKDNLFPSLFPFLIISYLLMNYGISYLFGELTKPFITKILHLPPSCGFTLIASMISGFPSSSKFIKDQLDREEITKEEANYLLSFCHFCSPLFVIGTIGTLLLGDTNLGILILTAHYLGNLVIALLFRPKDKQPQERVNYRKTYQKIKRKIGQSESFAIVLKNAIMNALETLCLLLGIVSIFLIITNLIIKVIPLAPFEKTILSGILEMTQGVKNASLLTTSTLNKSLLMEGIISFGGFSVHTQILSILSENKISYKNFLKMRILHVLFSEGILFLLFL